MPISMSRALRHPEWFLVISLGTCIAFLFALQPWLMRLSRTVYLWFFVRYDPDYKTNPVKKYV